MTTSPTPDEAEHHIYAPNCRVGRLPGDPIEIDPDGVCGACPPIPIDEWVADAVNHPAHYGGKDNPYEAIKVIHAWDLGFDLGNTVKYISRAGKKDPSKKIEDLEKALFYLNHHIADLKEKH